MHLYGYTTITSLETLFNITNLLFYLLDKGPVNLGIPECSFEHRKRQLEQDIIISLFS